MPTYFGYTTENAPANLGSYFWIRNKAYVTGFTCPGTGNQTVKEISLYCKSAGGTPANILLAVYNTSHNLICQGTAEVLVNSTTAGWRGHLTQADITPNPCTLTGGVQYDLAFSNDSSDVRMGFVSGGATAWTYANVDLTGGFPSSLPDSSDIGLLFSVRCGVDPAAQQYTLTAGAGSYTKTGQGAGLRAARKVAAGAGSYGLTGQDADLRLPYKLTAGAGSYGLTGQSVALKAARKMPAGSGSYSLSGQIAALKAARRMAGAPGSYVLTGQDVSFITKHYYTLKAEAGLYGEPYEKIIVTLDGRVYKKIGNVYLRLQ